MADPPSDTPQAPRCADCMFAEWVRGRPRPGRGAQKYLWCDSSDEWTDPGDRCELWEPKDA